MIFQKFDFKVEESYFTMEFQVMKKNRDTFLGR